MSPLPPRFLKRDASSFDICPVYINVVKCIRMLQFYARVIVELVCAAPVIGEQEQLAAIFLYN